MNKSTNNPASSPKNFWLVLLNALVLGWLGAHRFAVGKWKSALLQMFTFGGCGIWLLADILTILRGKFTDASGLVIHNTSKAPSWMVTGIVFLGVMMRLTNHSNPAPADVAPDSTPTISTTPAATAPAAPAVTLPADELAFVDAVTGFIPQYNSAPNELKKSAIRVSRKNRLQTLEPNLGFNGWIGQIAEMSTTAKGNASLKITLPGGLVTIATRNNELSDAGDNTLIPINSELFNRVADFRTGMTVKVSGRFLPGDDDYLMEASLTEAGSMTEPEFVVQFNQVEK